MNIQAISDMNFMAKPAQIKRITPLSEYAEKLLKEPISVTKDGDVTKLIDSVSNYATNYGKDMVKVAQSGDMLLINSGNITSTFKLNPSVKNDEPLGDMLKSLNDAFETNIRGNVIAEERGLKKGIEYIEINTPSETVGSKLNVLA